MRDRLGWMKGADHAILQVLGPPKRLALRTGDIAYNADLSGQWTSVRLGVLVDHGLVEKIEEEGAHPRYQISDLGVRFLRGEADVTELQNETEE
jgi:predicted transcriptional regulator